MGQTQKNTSVVNQQTYHDASAGLCCLAAADVDQMLQFFQLRSKAPERQVRIFSLFALQPVSLDMSNMETVLQFSLYVNSANRKKIIQTHLAKCHCGPVTPQRI